MERDRYLLKVSAQLVKKRHLAEKERAVQNEIIKNERDRSLPQGGSYFFQPRYRANV